MAASVIGAVLAGHFCDLGQSSPGWDLVHDSEYLAVLTWRALCPLLQAQHALVGAAETALATGNTSDLRRALDRMKALVYEAQAGAGGIIRLKVNAVENELVTEWSGDPEPEVVDAVRQRAVSVADDHFFAATASFLQFTARRYGSTVEVECDVSVASEPAGQPLQDFAAAAVQACEAER